ncbi:MAG: hypothetical protein C0596_03670 [Marinilabiliales bacterium]|nr:MAG: hypothetical protein C0596_03670 [Marinilabiliales bacterium]
MNKKSLLFLVFVFPLITVLNAQEYLDFNTGANRTKRILLVPFDPRIYYNDATSIMAEETGETHDEIMLYFREQFNLQLYNAMMDSCVVVNLLTDNTRRAQEDISELYSSISYELRLAMQNEPEDPDEVEKMNFLQRKRYEKEQQRKLEEMENSRTRIVDGEIVGKRQSVEDKYLHIIFHQPEVLEEIAARRDIDYFLFINQFDIKGNYGDPYLSGNANSERTIKVHFSLYNAQGKLIHGSFGENNMPFNLADRKEVANLYFPEVIRQIVNNIDY